jgi:hypothetical protein
MISPVHFDLLVDFFLAHRRIVSAKLDSGRCASQLGAQRQPCHRLPSIC